MSLRELYQEMIIDHGRNPRNFGTLTAATHHKAGHNPLCGDKIVVYVLEKNGVVAEIRFEGCGCAISMASASLMSEMVKGKTIQDVENLFQQFHLLVTTGVAPIDGMGKLAIFGGVSEFPVRVKCATLAWHTLKSALNNDYHPVTTE